MTNPVYIDEWRIEHEIAITFDPRIFDRELVVASVSLSDGEARQKPRIIQMEEMCSGFQHANPLA